MSYVTDTGRHLGTEPTNPDFERFAESFGIDSYRPETWSEVGTGLERVVPGKELSPVDTVLG